MKRTAGWALGVLAVALAWKVLILAWDVVPFNSDEAIVGLMARHILQGQGVPIFFYGQSYMGSLDALLVAAGFGLLGEAVWVIRAVEIGLFLGLLVSTACLGKVAFGKAETGWLAAALLAIPTVNLSLYSTVSLGGYGEALLIGNGLLICAVCQARRERWPGWLVYGWLAGLGLWANGLTLVYSLPGLAYLAWAYRKRWQLVDWARAMGLLAAGAALGALPWGIYAAQHGLGSLLGELLGSAVAVEGGGWLLRSGGHLVNLLLLGLPAAFGLRPPWGVTWLALPLLPFALVAWALVLRHAGQNLHIRAARRELYALFGGVAGVLFAAFIFTSFGVDPSGRYFLPLTAPLALCAADFVHSGGAPRSLRLAAAGVILAFQLWSNLQCALTYPPGFTTQFDKTTIIEHRDDAALIAFLQEHDVTRGYSQYWVAYPLAFRSGETLIFPPHLPYHEDLRYTTRDDRYLPYDEWVTASPTVAYITARQPELDERITAALQQAEIHWQEARIGDYHVFYDLSAALRPGELGLGLP